MCKDGYRAAQVANFFLYLAENEGREMSMLKLIKLSYIAHGWNLGLFQKPLVEEDIEAWQYGPVIPSLYHEFKHFGRRPIDRHAQELDWETFEMADAEPPKDKETRAILEKVWDVYKTSSGESLINKTHAAGTPWQKHYRRGERCTVIPEEDIRAYYADLLPKLVA